MEQQISGRDKKPTIDPHEYSQEVFYKHWRQYNGAKTVFSSNVAGIIEHSCAEKWI
jgi:hypothetical protein